MREAAMAWMVLLSSCAPALTQVRDDHPARASAASTPLPDVGGMLIRDEPAAAAAPAAPDAHAHEHHGGGHE